MSDDAFDIGDRALYNRLKAVSQAAPAFQAPADDEGEDFMRLATWLERRAEGGSPHDEESELTRSIEAMLLADVDLLDDLDHLAPPVPADMVPVDLLARAQALVPAAAKPVQGAVVVPFRLGRAAPAIGAARPRNVFLAWSALAACLAFIAVIGYDMGSAAGYDLYPSTTSSTTEMSIDILDAPNAALDGTS